VSPGDPGEFVHLVGVGADLSDVARRRISFHLTIINALAEEIMVLAGPVSGMKLNVTRNSRGWHDLPGGVVDIRGNGLVEANTEALIIVRQTLGPNDVHPLTELPDRNVCFEWDSLQGLRFRYQGGEYRIKVYRGIEILRGVVVLKANIIGPARATFR
jgi:hypothetical protein